MTIRIINADVMDGLAQLADESVHCVVTSPPYWGLRQYIADGSPEKQHEIGLEPTLAEHIDRLVQVFREVRRVLRKDGTVWCNYGDAFASHDPGGYREGEFLNPGGRQAAKGSARNRAGIYRPDGLKPKDLLMMPERLAIALQDDGWWVRARIIWHKPNPMPESVTDRPTKSHEHIWLLSKAPRYYYDAEAIREESDATPESQKRYAYGRYDAGGVKRANRTGRPDHLTEGNGFLGGSSRNARDVWTIATAPFPDAHFATFPPDLAERCILAGTSEKGCCAECGAPWVRVTGRACKACGELIPTQAKSCGSCGHVNDWKSERGLSDAYGTTDFSTPGKATPRKLNASGKQATIGHSNSVVAGWRPSCTCNADVVSCTVLDPFGGSGTTGLVADRLQRNAILIELNPQYAEMARNRIEKEAGLFTQVQLTAPAPAQAEHPHEPSLLSLMEAAE